MHDFHLFSNAFTLPNAFALRNLANFVDDEGLVEQMRCAVLEHGVPPEDSILISTTHTGGRGGSGEGDQSTL